MKTVKLFTLLLIMAFALPTQAQTVDEIIDSYFDNIGGLEKLNSLEGMKITAKVSQMGMEFPMEIVRMKDGRTSTSMSIQGQTYNQQTFDGETLWSHNMMTQQPEKMDAELTENFKLSINDFPNEFTNYKDKGYTVELLGKETIDGAETFKVKVIKEPITVDGKQEDDISFYYFDTENFVPIAMSTEVKTGPGKGMVQKISFSDYQEVDGLYFAHSWSIGAEGQPTSVPMTIEKIELNPTVEATSFAFPE
ncbi:MAG: outer membrane lipoprotein-sorting protein [Maribacter sp.]|uniref:outer membrane lipoprotein-sorting protein n=1 Tax=Maribacter sp. TaxID=1897614 RepID=UPI003297F901